MLYPSPAPDTCLLFLLRHGATANNLMRPPKLQGRGVDLPLSDEGRLQAERAARVLAQQTLAAVYSSTLVRAQETAAIIARHHQRAVTTDERLVEVDVGRWEMRSWVDIALEEPEAYRLFQEDPGAHGYAGGENLRQVRERVAPAIEQRLAAHLGEQIVVVGHNVVNRAYLAGVLELPLARARHLHQENCGLNILEYRAGQTKLVTLNAVGHLYDGSA
jgi:broad specificity phosphatase PhoE